MKKFRVSITDGFNSSEVGSTLTHICGNWNDSNSDYVFLECKDEDETYMIKNMENHEGVEEYEEIEKEVKKTEYTNIKIEMELVVPSYYADWGKEKLAEYLTNKLYKDPEYFGDFGEENIVHIGGMLHNANLKFN